MKKNADTNLSLNHANQSTYNTDRNLTTGRGTIAGDSELKVSFVVI